MLSLGRLALPGIPYILALPEKPRGSAGILRFRRSV